MVESCLILCVLCVLCGCVSVCVCEMVMHGHVQSPLYPKPYPAVIRKQWDLEAPPGYHIQLTFNYLDIKPSINCSSDSVMVLHNQTVLGKFCGSDTSDEHYPEDKPIVSPSNRLQLVFITDQSTPKNVQHLGFSAFYQATDVDECWENPISCSQFCHNFIGGYICSCRPGFNLGQDQHTCHMMDCGIPALPDEMVLIEKFPLTMYGHRISVRCSSQFYHLIGEESFTCDADGQWVSASGQNLSHSAFNCVPVCGVVKGSASGRIFGGEKAKLGQIPWQLLVREPRGGGSLISDRWAITAAHMVQNKKSMIFYGGMVDAQDNNRVEMETEKIIIHPGYNRETFDNDIALVKMTSLVQLSENILPVCLPEGKTNGPVMEGKMGTVSGYGAVSDKRFINRYLMYGHVKEYLEVPCFKPHNSVTDNMFCAGDIDKQVDSCNGDGGGPLVMPMVGFGSQDRPYRLKGIVSWGPPVCGNENYKSYYTKVENYLDWIQETMEKY